MELKYQGKTKDVYALADGSYLLKFKDDVTGDNGVFDPGANTVGLTVAGAGSAAMHLTKYFYEKLNQIGIPTHYLEADVENVTMKVKPATMFGRGLEVICRFRAVGSFMRRYGAYAKEGQALDALVEVTLKDDERNDPPISEDALAILGLLTHEEYQTLKDLTKKIASLVKDELAQRDLELYDIKLEFGRVGEDQHIALIDEISGGSLRAFRDGRRVDPIDLAKIVTGNK